MNILYQDDAILLIDKPAGLPVLPDGWDADAPYLLKLLDELVGRGSTLTGTRPDVGRGSGDPRQRLWVVHRLDKITSGVMVFARTAAAHRALNLQFERHEAQKVYHAICVGAPAWDEHTARHKLRVNVGHSHRTVVDNGKGVPAETHFTVLKRYEGLAPVGGYGLLASRPATGRTHQIRVHAYALGHPLVGDILYSAPQTDLIARPALHAFSLTITHPLTNERLTFEAPYPDDFARALARLTPDDQFLNKKLPS
ncbi:MAG: RluA family pseudouridine synthase [Anaerolineales bacterium]